MHGICINPRARRLVMKAYFSIVDVDAAWVFVLVVYVCVCVCCCYCWWFSCAHDSAIQCKRKTQATNVQPHKKIMRHVPDETAENATTTTKSSLLGLRKAKVASAHKNSIFSFCCSCRNFGAYLVSPHIISQSTSLQLAIAIAIGWCSSISLSRSLPVSSLSPTPSQFCTAIKSMATPTQITRY